MELGATPSVDRRIDMRPRMRQAGVVLSAFTHRFPSAWTASADVSRRSIRLTAGCPGGRGDPLPPPAVRLGVGAGPLAADALRRATRRSPSRMASGGGSGLIGSVALSLMQEEALHYIVQAEDRFSRRVRRIRTGKYLPRMRTTDPFRTFLPASSDIRSEGKSGSEGGGHDISMSWPIFVTRDSGGIRCDP